MNEICYRTGDVRTNQNPGLTILQIILMREHNRIADVLQQINVNDTLHMNIYEQMENYFCNEIFISATLG